MQKYRYVFLDTPSLSLKSIPSISQYIPVECKADVDGHEVWQNASHAQNSNQKPGATPLQKKHHCINFRPEWCDRKKVLALGRGYLAVTLYIYLYLYMYMYVYMYIIYIYIFIIYIYIYSVSNSIEELLLFKTVAQSRCFLPLVHSNGSP